MIPDIRYAKTPEGVHIAYQDLITYRLVGGPHERENTLAEKIVL